MGDLMVLKNVKSELEYITRSLKTYGKAKPFVVALDQEIIRDCASSIKAAHKINSAIPENQDEMLKEAALMVGKACQKLKTGQRKLKTQYGKFWRRDLNRLFVDSEQEIIEAISLLAIITRKEIPSREISFRTQIPGSYDMKSDKIKVSDDAYVYGLLDCIGELQAVISRSKRQNDLDFANKVFGIMGELFNEVETLTEFSNNLKKIKPKLAAAAVTLNNARKLLG